MIVDKKGDVENFGNWDLGTVWMNATNYWIGFFGGAAGGGRVEWVG